MYVYVRHMNIRMLCNFRAELFFLQFGWCKATPTPHMMLHDLAEQVTFTALS